MLVVILLHHFSVSVITSLLSLTLRHVIPGLGHDLADVKSAGAAKASVATRVESPPEAPTSAFYKKSKTRSCSCPRLIIVFLAAIEIVLPDLSILRDNADLAGFVKNFNEIVFDRNSFSPLLDLKAVDLFGYQSQIRNMDFEYQYSCRVTVDLLQPGYGDDFERARDGIQNFVLEFLVPHVPEGSRLHVKAMSLLLQVPFGGECQVWHTDEAEDEDDLVYSILIPCHRQSAPVFVTGFSPKLGPCGEKPLFGLGDMAFWDASSVVHAGSSADGVPPGHLLRAAVFISVGLRPSKAGDVIIHSGPDVEQWKDCSHPIIRFCVRCRRGVQPCEPRMKYCRLCVGHDRWQAKAVVCQWCHESDDHLHSDTKVGAVGENQVVNAAWRGYASPDRTLCVHGNPNFEALSESERLLAHFDEDELCGGFRFWAEFLQHVVPDEFYFKPVHRGLKPESWEPWRFFFKYFVDERHRGRSFCRRSYGLLKVTAFLCGFSSLFAHPDCNISDGSIPVFVPSNRMSAHAGSCLVAFRVAQANSQRVLLDQIADNRTARALLWLESDGVTTQCSCKGWKEFEGTVVPLSFHHQVRKCPGVTLRCMRQDRSEAIEVWINLFISQAHQDGVKFTISFAASFDCRCTRW